MPNHFSVDHLPFCASQPPERDHANDVPEHAPERRRFNHRRCPTTFVHLGASRCAIVIASTCFSRRLKNPSRRYQEHRERTLSSSPSPSPLSIPSSPDLELFEPSPFTRGGAPSPSRSASRRCRQDLDNPSLTHSEHPEG
uniref:Uncharacterized protein n=1 Tax=Oryza sativa subsp. japonica TaxID=39947 RepID=Q94GK4_ORYSJ|nr:hypothetical protein [Oryza sativa Japonica Group]